MIGAERGGMHARATIESYYEALRDGEPLSPFFVEDPEIVKIGVSEELYGFRRVADGLAEQTGRTDEWSVESHDLVVGNRETFAWFRDEVALSWYDRERYETFTYETRWTGTLERRPPNEWRFVSMHVSVPVDRTDDRGEDRMNDRDVN